MESLQEILSRKTFSPPDEAQAIKEYVQRRYKTKCSVTMSRGNLILTVPNSALAGSLQMERPKIIKDCRIKGKLVIRTGR